MTEVERATTFRGLPREFLEAFLKEMGGRPIEGGWEGAGWRASYTVRRVLVFIYMMDEIAFRIVGDEKAVDAVLKGLRSRAWRGAPPKG